MDTLKKVLDRTKNHVRETNNEKIPEDARPPLMMVVYEWKEQDPNHRDWINFVRDSAFLSFKTQHSNWEWKEEAKHLKEDLVWLLDLVCLDFSMNQEHEILPIAGWVLSRALQQVPPRTEPSWEE